MLLRVFLISFAFASVGKPFDGRIKSCKRSPWISLVVYQMILNSLDCEDDDVGKDWRFVEFD